MPLALVVQPRPSTLRCAFCHDEVHEVTRQRCPRCATLLHAPCLELLDRCPTLGCGNRLRRTRKLRVQWAQRGRTQRADGPSLIPVLMLAVLGLLAVVGLVRHFSFSVEGPVGCVSVRALRLHEDPTDYLKDTDGDGVGDMGIGVHVGYTPDHDLVWDVPIPNGSGGWRWEHHLYEDGSGAVWEGRILPKFPRQNR